MRLFMKDFMIVLFCWAVCYGMFLIFTTIAGAQVVDAPKMFHPGIIAASEQIESASWAGDRASLRMDIRDATGHIFQTFQKDSVEIFETLTAQGFIGDGSGLVNVGAGNLDLPADFIKDASVVSSLTIITATQAELGGGVELPLNAISDGFLADDITVNSASSGTFAGLTVNGAATVVDGLPAIYVTGSIVDATVDNDITINSTVDITTTAGLSLDSGVFNYDESTNFWSLNGTALVGNTSTSSTHVFEVQGKANGGAFYLAQGNAPTYGHEFRVSQADQVTYVYNWQNGVTSLAEAWRRDSSNKAVGLNGGSLFVGIESGDGTFHAWSGSAGSVSANAFADDVVAENSADGGFTVLTPDSNNAQYALGSPSNNFAALVRHVYANNQMSIGTNYAGAHVRLMYGAFNEGMRVDPNGNIGMGTTSISTTGLEVANTVAANAFLTVSNRRHKNLLGQVTNKQRLAARARMLGVTAERWTRKPDWQYRNVKTIDDFQPKTHKQYVPDVTEAIYFNREKIGVKRIPQPYITVVDVTAQDQLDRYNAKKAYFENHPNTLKERHGLTIEQIDKVFPTMVSYMDGGDKRLDLGASVQELIALTIDQQKQLSRLKKKVKALERR